MVGRILPYSFRGASVVASKYLGLGHVPILKIGLIFGHIDRKCVVRRVEGQALNPRLHCVVLICTPVVPTSGAAPQGALYPACTAFG